MNIIADNIVQSIDLWQTGEENLLLRDGKVEVVHAQKVYHINVVSQYSSASFGNEEIYKRMRLVLNRLGIKRIEYIQL